MNADGNEDVVTTATDSHIVVWNENLGGGDFGPDQTLALISGPRSIAFGDLNGDGNLDMAVAASNSVSWYSGDGTGAFAAEGQLMSLTFAIAVALSDVDNDGDLDVVGGGKNSDSIYWCRNTGSGSFSAPIFVTLAADSLSSMILADLDGDGRDDILSTSENDDKLAWYRNMGSGFGFQQNITNAGKDPNSTTVADLDNDGIMDIVVTNEGDNEVVWHQGLGMGVFGQAQFIGGGTDHIGLTSTRYEDLDSDGDRDLLVSAAISSRVSWYENVAELGISYCPGEPNSTGVPGRLAVTDLPAANQNSAALNAENLPQTQFGFFVTSTTQSFVANPGGSQGNLCLGGAIGRYNRAGEVLFTGAFGTMLLPIDLTGTPLPLGRTSVMAGETRNYQAWYRDTNPGPTSNFTDAVSVT